MCVFTDFISSMPMMYLKKETQTRMNQTAPPMRAKTKWTKFTESGQVPSHMGGKEQNLFQLADLNKLHIKFCTLSNIAIYTHTGTELG